MMAILIPGALLDSGLPDMSEMVSPEGLMITSITVALLGLAVMMLTGPRTGAATATETVDLPENAPPMEESVAVTDMPPLQVAEVPAAAVERAHLMTKSEPARSEVPSPVSAMNSAKLPPPEHATIAHRPSNGTKSLMAKVASLLPAGVSMPGKDEKPLRKAARGGNGFQPASRFSRAQQAFLRIPIVLTGRNEQGSEFREETCTHILLPQGAVIPMTQKVRAGDRMMLSNPSRQKEAECRVYGAQPGPDGRLLVEVDFPEEKSMWPVSFPAWSGPSAAASSGEPSTSGPTRTAALDSTGS